MCKRLFHLENFSVTFPAHRLNEENYGLTHDQLWPLTWYSHQDPEHYYRIKSGWTLVGVCKPPFPSRCEGNTRAFVAEHKESGEVYWWHFTPKTVVINPKD